MNGTSGTGDKREERLKQALKANLARRKAQAKARAGGPQSKPEDTGPAKPETGNAKGGKQRGSDG